MVITIMVFGWSHRIVLKKKPDYYFRVIGSKYVIVTLRAKMYKFMNAFDGYPIV